MALVLADRVLETTTTAGSGTITLVGAEPGYQSFSAVGNGNQTYYTITADTDWEVGIGTYTASGTTLSRDTVLSSSNSNAKVTFPAGVKKVFVTYPSEKSVNLDVSGNISLSSAVISGVGYPSVASDAATKSYVDNMSAAALHIHDPVVLATPASTGRNDTYNNGTAGVSATLTATANGTLTIDSTVAQAAQRVLIKDCDDQVENGIYVVTTVGDGSNPYVMTRSSDADTYGEQGANSLDEGSYFYVSGGTSLKGAAFVCNTPGVITFGSTNITFAEFSQTQVYTAGTGISLTNTVISLVSPVAVATGGTGTTTAPTNGQLLIGNGTGYTLSTLTAGSGVSITNSAGSITLSATGLGGTVTAVTATGPLASSGGTTPDISIANTTGTGSVVLENSPSIFSATITAALSASITTITGSSANITTVSGTTARFSSASITQLSGTSAGITTVSGTTTTFSSGTITQFGATSATITNVSGTNVTYSNGNLTSATVTTISGTTATYASATVTNLALTSLTITSLSITNLAASSATITTGNLTFSGTAQRITGDFSNATETSKLFFQTSTANGATRLGAIPNGTGTTANFNFFNNSNPTNASVLAVGVIGATETRINSTITGTGTYLPMTFYTGGSERMRLDTSGNLGIGTASPFTTIDVNGYFTAGVRNTTNISLTSGTHYFGSSPSDLVRNNIVGSINADSTTPVRLRFYKSRGTSASPTAVSSGDQTNDIQTYAYDGSSFIQATAIQASVTATPSANNVSSALSFFTNGGSSSPTERMRIDSSGNVGIGGTAPAYAKISVQGTLPTSSNLSFGFSSEATVPSGATSIYAGFYSAGSTQATSFTLNQWQHFRAWQNGFGAGSTVTNQYGYYADSNLTGATNNYGFFSDIASGSNRWNFYAAGTADNYFAGNVGIGLTSPPGCKLDVYNSAAAAANNEVLRLRYNTAVTPGTSGDLNFTNSAGTVLGRISSIVEDGNNVGLGFSTYNSAFTQKVLISANGNVGIGKTASTNKLEVSGTISDVAGNVRAIPRTGSAKTSTYTLTVSDVGQFVEIGTGGGVDVPNGVFATGAAVSVFNNTTGNRTISLTITTAYIAGTDADKASVTLATRGVATILFISNSVCVVSGNVS